MDANRFDCLARSLGAEASRRGIAKSLAGAALAGLTVPLGVREAAAKHCSGEGG